MSAAQGWQCPNCGKAHAPHVETCPEPKKLTDLLGDNTLPAGWPLPPPATSISFYDHPEQVLK